MLTTNAAATEAARRALRALGCVLPLPAVAEVLNMALPLIEDAGEPIEPDTRAELVATLRELAGHIVAGAPVQPSLRLTGRALGLLGSPVTPGAPIGVPRTTPGQDRASGVLNDPDRPTGGEHKLLSDQIAGLADVVTRSEGRTADRIADLARLIDLNRDVPVVELPSVELGHTEPTEADLWQAALGMADPQGDILGPNTLKRALWYLAWLEDGPNRARDYLRSDALHSEVETRPHLFSGVQRRPGSPGGETDPCWVAGCGLPPEADVHQLPGAGPNPIASPVG